MEDQEHTDSSTQTIEVAVPQSQADGEPQDRLAESVVATEGRQAVPANEAAWREDEAEQDGAGCEDLLAGPIAGPSLNASPPRVLG